MRVHHVTSTCIDLVYLARTPAPFPNGDSSLYFLRCHLYPTLAHLMMVFLFVTVTTPPPLSPNLGFSHWQSGSRWASIPTFPVRSELISLLSSQQIDSLLALRQVFFEEVKHKGLAHAGDELVSRHYTGRGKPLSVKLSDDVYACTV